MALFIDTEDFKNHAPMVHKHFDWDKELRPVVDQATRMRVIPFISKGQFDALETEYLGNTIAGNSKSLLEYLQPAIAYYTTDILMGLNRVHVGNMGIVENRSEDGTTSPASFHAISDAKKEVGMLADQMMDLALAFMEENDGDFSEWKGSDSYTKILDCFVWHTSLLEKSVKVGESRRTFLRLKPELQSVQQYEVLPELGQAFHDELISQQKATLTPENEKVIKRVRAWMSKQAILNLLPVVHVEITGEGLFFNRFWDGSKNRTTANNEAVRNLSEKFMREVSQIKTELLKFLEDNQDDYPLFTPGTYTAGDGLRSYKPHNNCGKNSFRV